MIEAGPVQAGKSIPTTIISVDNFFVGEGICPCSMGRFDDRAVAEVSLDSVRAQLLAAQTEPGSASTLAARAGRYAGWIETNPRIHAERATAANARAAKQHADRDGTIWLPSVCEP